jgi:hypothetical protein
VYTPLPAGDCQRGLPIGRRVERADQPIAIERDCGLGVVCVDLNARQRNREVATILEVQLVKQSMEAVGHDNSRRYRDMHREQELG